MYAFKALDNRKGSSLQAVKKYLKENEGIDSQKKAIYINKSVRKLTDDGALRHRMQKKRGRPKGAKTISTAPSFSIVKAKKIAKTKVGKRGRPKGAKNKSTVPQSSIVKAKKKEPKTKVGKRGRPKTKTDAEYPVKFVDLVLGAFKALDNRKGSSLQAVKKYLKENEGIDSQKKAIYINKSVRKLTDDGALRHRLYESFRMSPKIRLYVILEAEK
ncbi:sperm-specific protein PHI-2B/PHI-3-like [Penaeus japonicus]|uniref:sperm-specific protein PHI-2B/PHI-3-like n=1 Tax=Penaeus japonicus TaxID=27405 RepID=UPI001C711400|nr:sperm-specific protein PHI-2B/PHI-3-like [Penaeus japonicus]